VSSTGIHIDFYAPATLRKWPSLNSERISASLGARPYLVVEGTLDECIRQFLAKSVTPRHLYDHHTAQQIAPRRMPLHRQPTLLFWLQPMDVMVLRPRSSVRGTRGEGCQEESKANGKGRRTSQLQVRFCGVRRFLGLHKSFAKLAQGNSASFASSDVSGAGAGRRKLLAVRRNSL
jgi:hypothetical protein